jgi:hypothetical protein
MPTADVTPHFAGLDKKLSLADYNFEHFLPKHLPATGVSSRWLRDFMAPAVRQLPEHDHAQPGTISRDVLIGCSEMEADELWSFVQQKTTPHWVWIALDQHTRQVNAKLGNWLFALLGDLRKVTPQVIHWAGHHWLLPGMPAGRASSVQNTFPSAWNMKYLLQALKLSRLVVFPPLLVTIPLHSYLFGGEGCLLLFIGMIVRQAFTFLLLLASRLLRVSFISAPRALSLTLNMKGLSYAEIE